MIPYQTQNTRDLNNAEAARILEQKAWDTFLLEHPNLAAKAGDYSRNVQTFAEAQARVDLAMLYAKRFV